MGWWLIGQPRWVGALVRGGVFGLLLGLYFGAQHGWLSGVITGVVGGAIWGPLMTRVSADSQSSLVAAAGPLSAEELTAAVRAASRGPQPDDSPTVVNGAAAILSYGLRVLERQRLATAILFGVFAVLSVTTAVMERSWWWASVAAIAVVVEIRQLTAATRYRRRLRALDSVDSARSL